MFESEKSELAESWLPLVPAAEEPEPAEPERERPEQKSGPRPYCCRRGGSPAVSGSDRHDSILRAGCLIVLDDRSGSAGDIVGTCPCIAIRTDTAGDFAFQVTG